MSVKAKIVAGAATLTIVGGGLGMVGTMTASAATPNCGSTCVNIFSQKYGPQYLVDVFQAKSAAGTPVILFQASNSDPAEDFVVVDEGDVHSFYHRYGLVSAAFAKTYSGRRGLRGPVRAVRPEQQLLPVHLAGRGPAGRLPGPPGVLWLLLQLAVGRRHRRQHGAERLQRGLRPPQHRCNLLRATDYDVALINGASNSFSNPLVLNYPAGNPTDMPRPQLNVQPEKQYADGTTFDNQEWGTTLGAVH